MRRPDLEDLTAHVVAFGRALRDRGVLCGPGEIADALRALERVDVLDPEQFRLALRTTLVHSHHDLRVFDALYPLYWSPFPPAESLLENGEEPPAREEPAQEKGQLSMERWADAGEGTEGEQEVPGYSALEVLSRKDFSSFTDRELEEIGKLVVAIARRIATRMSRRMQRTRHSHRLDLRRTMRLHLRWGGELPALAFKRRRIRKTRLVLLCDVSGSMDIYSRFLIQFVYALQEAVGNVESFVFSTSLTRVTPALRSRTLREALDRLSRTVPNWSGGTRIGASLMQFLEGWRHLLDPRTVVVILSDGWDTGDVEILHRAMREIRARSGRVIWLNPLLGSPGYQPLTRGMQTALPFVDVFAAAHNLESLRALERTLAARPRRTARRE
ncbi:MAG: VWA domain-containing protein [Armatimonadota bacterium]|nr:VWA domain-containing protein [Armatimonadota bacterium]MDR7438728.1 VWA domain-containing protein [Armatimonadota bacterium]MDR7561944.1 VWA domain-containing protein [Armatimonadota bacterium]MDR7601855.1 VWA domain-containing protein [Armatimonadota bacterium]